ncbi:MAG: carboxypeptidase regulatory-like domain-containing protein [Candidatus Sericytochromatia bacterium]|nr:carboxypeptidase regulatory-like domain-containing protein [Candidatus Tanganyikabacteria bacterium]
MLLRVLLLALGAAMVAGCGAAPVTVRTPAGQTIASVTVRGKVVDKLTGRGVAGATVRLATGTVRTETAADGLFALGPFPAQGGQVVVAAEGFATRTLVVPAGAREALTIELARAAEIPAYRLSLTMQAGRLDGTGRVALLGDRLLVTGREGKLGALFNLDRVTGEEYDRFSWLAMFTPLPMELADVAAHPRAGSYLLTNAGRVHAFDARGRFLTSSAVAEGPGAMACDGRRLVVASSRKIRSLDPASLAVVDEWPFEYGDPSGLAVDSLGNLFVSTWEGRVVQLDADRRLIADWRQIVGPAAAPGSQGYAQSAAVPVQRLAGLALDPEGRALVVDPDGKRVVILGPTGQARGAFGAADLRAPRGIVVDERGTVYVGDVSLRAALRFDRIPGTSAFAALPLP